MRLLLIKKRKETYIFSCDFGGAALCSGPYFWMCNHALISIMNDKIAFSDKREKASWNSKRFEWIRFVWKHHIWGDGTSEIQTSHPDNPMTCHHFNLLQHFSRVTRVLPQSTRAYSFYLLTPWVEKPFACPECECLSRGRSRILKDYTQL